MGGTNTPTDFNLNRADKATTWPEAVGYLIHAVANVQERLEEQAEAIEELHPAPAGVFLVPEEEIPEGMELDEFAEDLRDMSQEELAARGIRMVPRSMSRPEEVDRVGELWKEAVDLEEKAFERIQKLESKVRRLGEMISDGADTRVMFGDALEKLDERLKSVEQGMGAIQSGETQPTVRIEDELEQRLDDLEHGLDFVAGEVSDMIEQRLEAIERDLEGGEPSAYLEECVREAVEHLQKSTETLPVHEKSHHRAAGLGYMAKALQAIVDEAPLSVRDEELADRVGEVEQKIDDTDELVGDILERLSRLAAYIEDPGPMGAAEEDDEILGDDFAEQVKEYFRRRWEEAEGHLEERRELWEGKEWGAPLTVPSNHAYAGAHTLYDLLMLVPDAVPGDVPSVDEISSWDVDTRERVEKWAGAVHLTASDHHDVDVPPVPEVLRAELNVSRPEIRELVRWYSEDFEVEDLPLYGEDGGYVAVMMGDWTYRVASDLTVEMGVPSWVDSSEKWERNVPAAKLEEDLKQLWRERQEDEESSSLRPTSLSTR